MNIFKSRLIFGAIKRIVCTVLKTIYRVLSVFNLQVTILILILGLILLITGVFASVPTLKTVFWILLALSIVLAGFLTVSKVKKWGHKIFGKKKDTRLDHADVSQVPEQLNNVQSNIYQPQTEQVQTQPIIQTANNLSEHQIESEYQTGNEYQPERVFDVRTQPKEVYPQYYRVKQNPKYVFAEYADRYELFYDNGYNLAKVRTDYKK